MHRIFPHVQRESDLLFGIGKPCVKNDDIRVRPSKNLVNPFKKIIGGDEARQFDGARVYVFPLVKSVDPCFFSSSFCGDVERNGNDIIAEAIDFKKPLWVFDEAHESFLHIVIGAEVFPITVDQGTVNDSNIFLIELLEMFLQTFKVSAPNRLEQLPLGIHLPMMRARSL